MELRDISMDDLSLYRDMLTDPAMMSELGGPLPERGLEEKLRGIVAEVEAGLIWYLVILPDGARGIPAGTVCVWDHVWEGDEITEIGWMVVPGFQGRGIASGAVSSLLKRARLEERWDVIHAFPGVANEPSNAICRKFGFTKVGELDFEYVGRTLRGNHWVLHLRD